MKAWALLSNQEDRTWESNEGYQDVLGSQYAYDSGVANHLQVGVDDIVVVRNSAIVQGVSRIDRIDSEPGTKVRLSCPQCHRTGFIKRITKTPTFLCRHQDCRNEFEEPRKEDAPVTLYVASYGAQWEPLDGALSYADVEPILDRAQQNAIRRCDADQLEQLLSRISVAIPPVPAARTTPPKGGHRSALVKVRVGQAAFRQQLLHEYGLVCAITGPCPAPALQAAHLRAFAKHGSHDLADGLLLRSDIHQLFDAGLVAVDTATMKVVVAPSLAKYPNYKALQGISVKGGVYVAALADHYSEATSSW
ncbi:HNH endonuclease [Nocardia abscessus]|uniref:HNH endonuclease n=1 Tax=Nocardia abscessus TaxID=120957 RepID=UPI002457D411|nr:HNH endonuclease signature motif containing protein [Nocardia abscessus]